MAPVWKANFDLTTRFCYRNTAGIQLKALNGLLSGRKGADLLQILATRKSSISGLFLIELWFPKCARYFIWTWQLPIGLKLCHVQCQLSVFPRRLENFLEAALKRKIFKFDVTENSKNRQRALKINVAWKNHEYIALTAALTVQPCFSINYSKRNKFMKTLVSFEVKSIIPARCED